MKNLEIPDCKKFTGYKPCAPYRNCLKEGCKDFVPIGKKILIINLDAMGDVLMTTAQLGPLKRKYPESSIYWLTLKNASALLENNHIIDRVFKYDFSSLSILEGMDFDLILNVDKSLESCAMTMKLNAKEKLGFGLNGNGQIVPLNEGAMYNYRLGTDDLLKFRQNKKTGEEYLSETFNLDYNLDEYSFFFTGEEKEFTESYRHSVGIEDQDQVIGFNTGCSTLYPNKKMTLEQQATLIERFLSYNKFKIILLGGPEDEQRNRFLEESFLGHIISTPVKSGLRRGACFMNLADLVITGDSFGMHLAIALKKHIISWFGLSCPSEIELFGRGIKLVPEGLSCAPCWNKKCPKDLECIQMIDLEKIEHHAVEFFKDRQY